jgi:hypothetical protein
VSEYDPAPETVEALRCQTDEALEPLLGAIDAVYDACSTLTEVENAVLELAGGSTHDERYLFLEDQTRVADLRIALYAVQARVVERHRSRVPPDLADISPDELREALGR